MSAAIDSIKYVPAGNVLDRVAVLLPPEVGEIVWQYGHCYDREAALEHMIRYVNLYRCEFDFYSVEVSDND